MNFVESSDGTGKLKIGSQDSSNNVDNANGAYCFPVESLLAALNQTVVDFLSLDVEGVELDILKTIPFDRLNFRVMAVEYIHGNKTQYKEFMSKRGFYVHKDISYQKPVIGLYVEDFIFVNNSTLKLGSPVTW